MEYLFKLKKDGKTVGYLKIISEFGRVLLNPISRPGYWTRYDGVLTEKLFNSVHPFVTEDKNGKDVFAGDLITGKILDVSSEKLIGIIVPNENSLSCCMFKWNYKGKEYLAPAPDLQDIELIEEKEDD